MKPLINTPGFVEALKDFVQMQQFYPPGGSNFTLTSAADSFAKDRIIFGGGPAGGTFQVVANGIQVYKPIKAEEDFSVKAQTSAGSIVRLFS